MNWSRHTRYFCWAILLAIASAPTTAGAAAIYTYQGNTFDGTAGSYACPPTCNISGWFAFAEVLGPNADVDDHSVLSWNFTNGGEEFTPENSQVQNLYIQADSSGGLLRWTFTLRREGSSYIRSWHGPSMESETFPAGSDRAILLGLADVAITTADWTFQYGCGVNLVDVFGHTVGGGALSCAPIGWAWGVFQEGQWTVTENDVIYPPPVPEPGALVLLSVGFSLTRAFRRVVGRRPKERRP